jgi:hypothetical protein
VHFILEPQGEIAYIPASKKRVLITDLVDEAHMQDVGNGIQYIRLIVDHKDNLIFQGVFLTHFLDPPVCGTPGANY